MAQAQSEDLGNEVVQSQREWLGTRRYLNAHRHELSQRAAELYRPDERIGSTGLLTKRAWLPSTPVPLDQVRLVLSREPHRWAVDGSGPESAALRPFRAAGSRFPSYSAAVAALAAPRVFENRPTYRLLDAATTGQGMRMAFGLGTYFDLIDVSEAVAHELAAAARSEAGSTTLRRLAGDPCDLGRRSVSPAISALTIRRSDDGSGTFVLHRRDNAKVAHGGGLYQVMPVGVFQPSGDGSWNEEHDFDLWRSIIREYSEEFLGEAERTSDAAPIDYEGWQFSRQFSDARAAGEITGHLLGVGIDPLSLVCDLLVAVVIAADTFDSMFKAMVEVNDEGSVVGNSQAVGVSGFPFDADTVEEYVQHQPMQAAGKAVLQLAWDHRDVSLASQ